MIQKKDLSLVHEVLAPQEQQEKPPVLIMLHGYGSHEQDLFSMAPMLNNKFMMVSVRAPHSLPWGGFAWYEINFEASTGEKFSNTVQAKESLNRIHTFIDEVHNAYGTDRENTWLMGFSQGAILSYGLSLNYPEKLKGALTLSGYILEDLLPQNEMAKTLTHLSYFVSHGIQDEVIPIDWARNAVKVLEKLKLSHQYREYPMGHGITPECFDDIKVWLKEKNVL